MNNAPFKKILHVDDDHVLRLMTKTALTRSNRGFEVESCFSGKDAIEKIETFLPDLLLVDLVMPVMDGPSFVRAVREIDTLDLSRIPVVFVTGKENPQIENKIDLEPVIGIILKPFQAGRLADDLIALWDAYQKS